MRILIDQEEHRVQDIDNFFLHSKKGPLGTHVFKGPLYLYKKVMGLKNYEVLKKFLDGTHRTQTKTVVGYEAKKDVQKREVGEIWEETLSNGTVIEWEQKKGYRVKRPKNLKSLLELRSTLYEYTNCFEDCEKKSTKKYSRYDQEVCTIHNMCLDCLSRVETQLKIEGTFDEYERQKKLQSLQDLFRDAEKEKEVIKNALQSIEYINEDGSREKWDIESKSAFLNKIDTDFEELKNSLIEPLLKSPKKESE